MAMPRMSSLDHDGELGGTYREVGLGTQPAHAVQFYEDDAFMVSSVGDYLASGLAVGQRVLAVITTSHRDAIRAHLEERGLNVERAMLRGQLLLADAHELLDAFMVDGRPDPQRFRSALDRPFRAMDGYPSPRPVRVFGEMVDLLCREGNVNGAIALEALWNELAAKESFSLLCAYSMSSFGDGGHTANVASICGAHSHVIPTERYTQVSAGARLREIALLQQRAQALAAEVERGRELERSLRDALWRAESASRAKGEFLAMMSHELRTPLNAIGGHVQLMELGLHGPVTDRQREALARVQRSQRHLLALINDVLNLARAESHTVEYLIAPMPLLPLVTEVVELLSPLFSAQSLSCTVSVDDALDAAPVLADREKVHQILLNLLGNALKFTPAGGSVSVRISPSRDAAAVEVAVRDTGIGIPHDKLEQIFQPFVQLSGPSTEPRQGIGLGLSISRALARGMRGDLVAESDEGSGTVLTLTLPVAGVPDR
jgi:signal transduction histidine kinase